jgi:hypothetical protein
MSGIGQTQLDGKMSEKLQRNDAQQSIDRMFSGAGNTQQQEASHNAEVFVKGLHGGELNRALHCPIAMLDKRSSQCV